MTFFKRSVNVTIARPLPTSFFATLPNAIEITGLRVQFRVERTIGKEPNSCEIIVSNLSEGTRAELQSKPLQVSLDAGYEDDISRLFVGDLRWTESARVGADFESKMLIADGDRSYREARLNRSYKAGTKRRVVLKAVADAMGVALPSNVTSASEFDREEVSGVALRGFARDEMTRLAALGARDWSLQNGRLQLLEEDETRPGNALDIAEDRGLVGTPAYGAPPKKGKKPTLRIRSLLRADAVPGGLVRLTSAQVSGNFKIFKVVHNGDTFGQNWYTDLDMRPI